MVSFALKAGELKGLEWLVEGEPLPSSWASPRKGTAVTHLDLTLTAAHDHSDLVCRLTTLETSSYISQSALEDELLPPTHREESHSINAEIGSNDVANDPDGGRPFGLHGNDVKFSSSEESVSDVRRTATGKKKMKKISAPFEIDSPSYFQADQGTKSLPKQTSFGEVVVTTARSLPVQGRETRSNAAYFQTNENEEARAGTGNEEKEDHLGVAHKSSNVMEEEDVDYSGDDLKDDGRIVSSTLQPHKSSANYINRDGRSEKSGARAADYVVASERNRQSGRRLEATITDVSVLIHMYCEF